MMLPGIDIDHRKRALRWLSLKERMASGRGTAAARG